MQSRQLGSHADCGDVRQRIARRTPRSRPRRPDDRGHTRLYCYVTGEASAPKCAEFGAPLSPSRGLRARAARPSLRLLWPPAELVREDGVDGEVPSRVSDPPPPAASAPLAHASPPLAPVVTFTSGDDDCPICLDVRQSPVFARCGTPPCDSFRDDVELACNRPGCYGAFEYKLI